MGIRYPELIKQCHDTLMGPKQLACLRSFSFSLLSLSVASSSFSFFCASSAKSCAFSWALSSASTSWQKVRSNSRECKRFRHSIKQHIYRTSWTMADKYTAWCSEIGSLWSLDAPELHASVTSENQIHCTRLYITNNTICL